ncbi:hypothetical protein VE03_09596 [Pseudogymnoascus sp. 23342-1-I1]|nr:hypothetical protein VE03_09596 [Pseudogymnoascus sp. 23342-1-I1]
MTANDGAVSLDDGLENAPGKLFAESRNEDGVLKYTMFSDKPLRWRDDIPPPETYQEALRDKALQAQEGYVFHAQALRILGVKVFRTGDYHIVTTLRGKRDVVKFQTKEFLPGVQKWTGLRDIGHLAFLSVEDGELPVYHFWLDPTIFEKSPDQMTLAETIDAATDRLATEEETKKSEDGVKMRLMPNITPSDQIWIDKLAEFQKLLANNEPNGRKRTLADLMKETFLDDQIRRLAASGEHSWLSVLQGRDQLLYFENLDNGAFKGVKNNAATKFCMVYFGLPVEPLTLTNILNARKNGDDARDKVEPDFSMLPRIYGAEADLEFLDSYHERAYGYPALRKPKAKRPYKAIPEEVSDLIQEQQRIEQELYPQPKRMCGGNKGALYNRDSYEFAFETPENNVPPCSFEEFLALRGGAGPSQIPEDTNDDDAQPNDNHFSDMEDVIMSDIALPEGPDGDCEEAVAGPVPYSGDVNGLPSSPQHTAWIDGFGGGLRGGASSPRTNERGGEGQTGTSSSPPNVNNGPGTNTNNAAPSPSVPLPPFPSMEAVLANLQQNPRRPSNVRRRLPAHTANKNKFDPSQHREYMLETAKNLEQDDLRVAAYHKEQSVHEPHAARPEPPRYGKSVENQLVTGPTTPGVFANSSTLSEIRQLQARNAELERLFLGRALYCGLCDKSISFTTNEQREAHFAGHVDGLHSCGFCGLRFNAADRAWRKSHLASHADVRYTKKAPNTPQQPVHNAGSRMPTPVNSSPKQVAQTTGVDGDTILYCQNCSVDLAHFTTPAQLIQHARSCSGRSRPPSEPAYCKFCGIEIIRLGSADDITNHRNLCKGSAAGQGRQRELWAAAGTSAKDDRELTYWKLCALTGVPDLHYKPRTPAPKSYECRYSGCDANLLQVAKDGTLDAHHKGHISNGDRLRNICQADGCGEDLAKCEKQGKERLQRHLTRHLKNECTFPGCTEIFRDEDVSPSTHDIEVEAKKKWIDHAHSHLGLDEDESVQDFPDSDPESDDDDNDGHGGGLNGPAANAHQGNGGNTNVGPRSTEPATGQTQGNNPTAPPAPKDPGPATNTATTPRKVPQKPSVPAKAPTYFTSLPKQWTDAIRKLPERIYLGSGKKQKAAFICPWHRSVCPDGTKGCGVDNDNNFLIFSALSAGRIRNPKQSYDHISMIEEGAGTWGVTQRLAPVAQYIARHPPLADQSPLPLPHPTMNNPTEEELKSGRAVRKQQLGSHQTIADKKRKRAQKGENRGATTAAPGEPPAKVAKQAVGANLTKKTRTAAPGGLSAKMAKEAEGGSLPKATQIVAPKTPIAPPGERQGGGLFVTPDT